jgi:hypothetical protein
MVHVRALDAAVLWILLMQQEVIMDSHIYCLGVMADARGHS